MSRYCTVDTLIDIAHLNWMDTDYYTFYFFSLNASDLLLGRSENFQEEFIAVEN